MAIFLATIAGLVVWIVMWAVGVKSFDAFMVMLLIILLGCTAHILAPFLPGNRKDAPPPGA
jgi:Mn2+/Fe2+ NRAMP family transporter